MRGVIGGDISVSNLDFGLDLLVEELGPGEGASDFALEVVEGEIARLELVVELLLGVGSLDLSELGVDVFGQRR